MSRQASEGHRQLDCAGLSFVLQIWLQIQPSSSGAHLRVPMAQFKGQKNPTSCSRRSRGDPRRRKRLAVCCRWDCDVGGWRSGVIRNAADPRLQKRLDAHMMCAYHEEMLVQ